MLYSIKYKDAILKSNLQIIFTKVGTLAIELILKIQKDIMTWLVSILFTQHLLIYLFTSHSPL